MNQLLEPLQQHGYAVYPRSVKPIEGGHVFVARQGARKLIGVACKRNFPPMHSRAFGPMTLASGAQASLHEPTWENYQAVRQLIPLGPVRCDRNASLGMGDRLGMATPAHLDAAEPFPVFPVIAQQSPRELTKTLRTFRDVLLDAAMGALEVGFDAPWGADADHIKDEERLTEAVRAGYSMYTLDLSGWVSPSDPSDLFDESDLSDLSRRIVRKHSGQGVAAHATSEQELLRSAAVYQRPLENAVRFHRIIRAAMPDFDLEVSMDEASQETTLEDHLFAAEYLHASGVALTSLAPRFPGKFRKGVDFIGDVADLAASMRMHARLAREIGGYKLSLHSGSDKWLAYRPFGEAVEGLFHVKTSGTSWLEALSLVSEYEPELYKVIYTIALAHLHDSLRDYDTDINLRDLPPRIPPGECLDRRDRNLVQLFHISYGALLAEKGDEIRALLAEHEARHYERIATHMRRHLEALA